MSKILTDHGECLTLNSTYLHSVRICPNGSKKVMFWGNLKANVDGNCGILHRCNKCVVYSHSQLFRHRLLTVTFVPSGFLPLSSLRLIVPPLQLVSAALWEIVRQGAVMYYGLLEDFVTTVLETVPELLTCTERVQLAMGLRAKVRMRHEMCTLLLTC